RIDSATSRWTGSLTPGATARLDWSRADSLDFTATIRREHDSVVARGRHAKQPLWRGHDSVAVFIADAAPYYQAFGIGDGLPRPVPARDTRGTHRTRDANGTDETQGGGVTVTAAATWG